ncbi:MAG TPA: IS66 family transposase [Ktedonobacteraceae bacterium]|nr:IS66 family transposase [Ktedonobacteraceae bacterium]
MERIAQRETEVAELREQVAQALARIHELEGQQSKNSRNSSKPPASDGWTHQPKSQRKASGQKRAGQVGHAGHHLELVQTPDEVRRYRPSRCAQCQCSLEEVDGDVAERRQVLELPPMRLVVTEHQVEAVQCPRCHSLNQGNFPTTVCAPAQYGTGVKALAVYLHQYHLVPLERTVELLEDLCGSRLSEGTRLGWEHEAASRLEPTMERLAEAVACSRLQHADETGIRVEGKLHWLHVNSTRFLTHLAWHKRRGRTALEAIGIWPRFGGRAMHARWKRYDGYPCAHSVCAAHVLRELTLLSEHEQQEWAAQMKDRLLSMHDAAQQWQERGAPCLALVERDEWVAQYFAILLHGSAAQSCTLAPASPTAKRRRPKQAAAKQRLDDLLRRAEQVLAFRDDLSILFTNNQAERDLRMVKVQQKSAGTFRSAGGATVFCRIRSDLSTMRKQDHRLLAALTAVFAGQPFPIASNRQGVT